MNSLIHTLRVIEQIDSPRASGERIAALFAPYLTDATVTVTPITGPKGKTDFVRVVIPGSRGKQAGGTAPTLGVVGRLGGVCARPTVSPWFQMPTAPAPRLPPRCNWPICTRKAMCCQAT